MKKKSALLLAMLLAVSSVAACGGTGSGNGSSGSSKADSTPKTYLTELPEITDGNYPEKFDLRDYGYVTGVKLQNPFGYCWAFASVAAAETSILSELGKNCDEYPLDLSEHHLAWFTKQHIPAEGETGYDSSNKQSGEGYYTTEWTDDSDAEGSLPSDTILALASGTGIASEETAPYKGKNGTVSYVKSDGTLTDLKPFFGGLKYCYSADDDWSLDEDIRYSGLYDLEAGYELPDFAANGDTLRTDGISAVKEMLTEGRGVAVSYASDAVYTGSGNKKVSRYINTETYAHYTYDEALPNHVVEIVGWDDNYSRENFKSDEAVCWDEIGEMVTDEKGNYVFEDGETPLPAGDGAWIVKNSWGAETEEFPNYGNFGVDGSGYLYISYYDKSLSSAVAFDFDTGSEGGTYDITEQYDFLFTSGEVQQKSKGKISAANVFEAPENMELDAVGTFCAGEDMNLIYEIYLQDDESADPTEGTLAATMEKHYSYEGYYREKLETPVELKKGQKYAVVVTSYREGESREYYCRYTESLLGKDSIAGWLTHDYYVGVVNKGESYIYFEGKGWEDFADYLEENNGTGDDSTAEDNFCIKAFGNIIE